MRDKNAEKQLIGPFQSEANPANYYVAHQDGTTTILSPDVLFAGTVTVSVPEEEQKTEEQTIEEEAAVRFQKMRDDEGLVTVGMTVAP